MLLDGVLLHINTGGIVHVHALRFAEAVIFLAH